MKTILLATVLGLVLGVMTGCPKKDGNDDELGLLALGWLSIQPKRVMQGSAQALASSSAASAAATAAGSVATSTAAAQSAGAASTFTSVSFNGTKYCNGTAALVTTDQGKGSVVISNSSLSGSFSGTLGSTYTQDLTYSMTATFTNCQMQAVDMQALQSFNGNAASLPVVNITLNGPISNNAQTSASYNYSTSGGTTTINGNGVGSGTVTSSGFTVISGGQTTLNNAAIDLQTSTSGSLSATSNPSAGTSSLSFSGNIKQSGTVGGESVLVDWDYSFSFSVP